MYSRLSNDDIMSLLPSKALYAANVAENRSYMILFSDIPCLLKGFRQTLKEALCIARNSSRRCIALNTPMDGTIAAV